MFIVLLIPQLSFSYILLWFLICLSICYYKRPTNTNLWYYYRNLQCTAYIQDDKIQIILNIPLLNVKHIYEIYKVINIPIPIKTNQSDENNLVISTQYILESHAFMITKDRSYYSLLDNEELNSCRNTQLKFCNPTKPLFPTNLNRNCLITLFNKDLKKINTYCEKLLIPYQLPNAIYLERNVYMIYDSPHNSYLTFTIHCKGLRDFKVDISNMFVVLYLNDTCSAVNKNMILQSRT